MHSIRERWAHSQTPRASGVVGSFTCAGSQCASATGYQDSSAFHGGLFCLSHAVWSQASTLAWAMACTDPRLSDRHRTECRTAYRPWLAKAKNRLGVIDFKETKGSIRSGLCRLVLAVFLVRVISHDRLTRTEPVNLDYLLAKISFGQQPVLFLIFEEDLLGRPVCQKIPSPALITTTQEFSESWRSSRE